MNESILNGILIFGIIQAFFFSLQHSTKKNKTLSDIIVGFWLLILASQIFFIVLNLNNQNKTGFLFVSNPQLLFTLLHGPFLYQYVQKLVLGESSFTKKDTYHFIPFFVGLVISLIFYFTNIDSVILLKGIAVTGAISGLLYFIIALSLLQKHKRRIKNDFSYTERINLNWLLNLTIGLLTIWVGASVLVVLSRFCSIDLPLTWSFTIVPVFIFYIGFCGIRQQIIYTTPVTEAQNKVSVSITEMPVKISDSYKKSGLQVDNMKTINARLLKSMQQDRLFLNPTLSLSALSKELNIPAHHLTQTLNEYADLSFYDFVNSFRVNEFKKRIHAPENKNFSLLGIAFDCGFNSKSSFNRIFKQKTALSPSEYQKKSIS